MTALFAGGLMEIVSEKAVRIRDDLSPIASAELTSEIMNGLPGASDLTLS